MNWYLTKIVYRIICGDGSHTPQFDEQLRLVKACDERTAFEKGKAVGLQEEEIFCNDKQQLVQWKYVNVAEVFPLTDLIDGAELYSQIKETPDAEAYCSFVNYKAGLLREKYNEELFQLI